MRDIYIISNLNPLTKFTIRNRSIDIDDEGHLNQQDNSPNLCDETDHPSLILMKSQWKLKQQQQNFAIEVKSL